MYLHKISGRIAGAAILLLAAAVPAAAADPAASSGEATAAERQASSAETAKRADEPRKICQTFKMTSSRLGSKRICMTREEWKRVKFD
jgi:Ni/Co efflux regulator RcnB